MPITIPTHNYPHDLLPFVTECRSLLIVTNPSPFNYPDTLVGTSPDLATWNENVPRIKELNEPILGSLRQKANLYTIYKRCHLSQPWTPVYVGHSKSKEMRGRITAHMIKKDDGTGAQLDQVMSAVGGGNLLAVSFLLVQPESLRLVVEECILGGSSEGEFPWNKYGR
jgi:hypothetical protein